MSKKLALFDKGKVLQRVFYTFHSRLDGVENLLLEYIVQTLKPDKTKKGGGRAYAGDKNSIGRRKRVSPVVKVL